MRRAARIGLLALAACGGGDATPAIDAPVAADAPIAADAPTAPDARELPVLADLCRTDDADRLPSLPTVAKAPVCTSEGVPDAAGPLFAGDLGTLPEAYTALHALCARMDPTALTRDDLADAALAADVRAYLTARLADPPLARALAALPDADARLAALEEVWLPGNGFEHVLCGDLNPNGRVGGLHLWSELYFAEREGRADYVCTRGGVGDDAIAAVQYRWQPPGRTTSALKPLGSMQVGASPACLLALGYAARHTAGVTSSPGDIPAFVGELYGVRRNWVLVADAGGALVTLYPHALP